MSEEPTRRAVLLAAASAALPGSAACRADTSPETPPAPGRLQQSVSRWCFGALSLDELAAGAARLGLVGLDLLTPDQFPVLKKYGLVCTMTKTHALETGLNDPSSHDSCLNVIHDAIQATAAAGFRNVICFSGNRRGMDDRTGMDNCVQALRQIVPVAEEANVILHMELLNSRIDHPDYMCDRSEWGIELVRRVASDHFRLLYDIYHMQIMEGDIIRTIQRHHEYFGHYHTGGNPGRHELDASQELNYAAICQAIADTGYTGYLAHEFLPIHDPLTSLQEAVSTCSV